MVGKDECWLLVERRADEASINELIWVRMKMKPRKRARSLTPTYL